MQEFPDPPMACKELAGSETIHLYGKMDSELTAGHFLATTSMQRQGLEQQFERIMQQHGPGIARLVSAYERNLSSRDDLVQEIALAIWRALPAFRQECSERTLAFRIAHNRTVTHFSRRRRVENLDEAVNVPDVGKDPERQASEGQLRERLHAAIERMAPAHRHVVVLLLEGMTHAEIADILGISEGNVAVRATRARKELRALMEGDV